MPDRQFAPDVRAFNRTYSVVTHDVGTPRVAVPPRPYTPRVIPDNWDQETIAWQQQRLIQREYTLSMRNGGPTFESAQNPVYAQLKQMLDVTLALPALILLAPVMLVVALAIRLDSPGPAVFKQRRVGKGGKLFTMYKFRSMTVDAGVRLNGQHKTSDDDRVTRVGRFIRKTSLDELPQLVNVLLGQMSLVGPRPELPEIVLQRYQPWQYRRLAVPQGITGWWQVTGRGKKMLWKHTDDDLYYVERASFWFDLKLIFMTVKAVFSRDGAF
jgi:lipopolysaccharide/colanic/teichoic acid biosynthesis glycosyltransferase